MGPFEFYICLIFGLLVFCVGLFVMEIITSLLKEPKKDKLEDTLKSMFLVPKMFASTPESFEEQICLLMTLKHQNKDIWHELQTFKKKYGILSAHSLSSKYTFESQPNICEILKDFVDSL